MTDITLSNKEVKKMTMQEKAKEAHAHHEHLKQIALKLFEQLKSEKIDSDAERIVSMLSASVKSERDNRML